LTREQIVQTDTFAQPGHHNFRENFRFEPRLDPQVPPDILAELDRLGGFGKYMPFTDRVTTRSACLPSGRRISSQARDGVEARFSAERPDV
jgi:hypothetical protein